MDGEKLPDGPPPAGTTPGTFAEHPVAPPPAYAPTALPGHEQTETCTLLVTRNSPNIGNVSTVLLSCCCMVCLNRDKAIENFTVQDASGATIYTVDQMRSVRCMMLIGSAEYNSYVSNASGTRIASTESQQALVQTAGTSNTMPVTSVSGGIIGYISKVPGAPQPQQISRQGRRTGPVVRRAMGVTYRIYDSKQNTLFIITPDPTNVANVQLPEMKYFIQAESGPLSENVLVGSAVFKSTNFRLNHPTNIDEGRRCLLLMASVLIEAEVSTRIGL